MILSFKELSEQIDYDFDENISNDFLKSACRLAGIIFSGGGIIFVKKGSQEEELSQLLKNHGRTGRIIVYLHLPKKNAGVVVKDGKLVESIFSYYKIFIFYVKDVWKIKKAIKAHKLKAFL